MLFDIVVVTSSNFNQCELFQKELLLRRGRFGLSTSCKVIALADPFGIRVGSGGATFYAIAEAYEQGKCMLILHSGGDSRRNPLCTVSGKGFAALNFGNSSECSCPLDRLLEQLETIKSTPGVLIAATDVLMTNFQVLDDNNGSFCADKVTGVGIYTPWIFGTRHGVYYKKSEEDRYSILQKATESTLKTLGAINEQDQVLLDSGIIHFGETVVTSILDLMTISPFVGLTDKGMDSGIVKPARFDLYTDLMGALNSVHATKSDFLDGTSKEEERAIRELLHNTLNKFELSIAELTTDCQFVHVGTTLEHRNLVLMQHHEQGLELVSRYKSFEALNNTISKESVLINSHVTGISSLSKIADGCLVEHSLLRGFFQIGKGAIVSQVRTLSSICVTDDTVLQEYPVSIEKLKRRYPKESIPEFASKNLKVFVIFGVMDGIKEIFPKGTFRNCHWIDLPHHLTSCLWPSTVAEEEKSLWNARLFPVLMEDEIHSVEHAMWLMQPLVELDEVILGKWKSTFRISLSDLVWISNNEKIFNFRHLELPNLILQDRLLQAIWNRNEYPIDCFPLSLNSGSEESKIKLLHALDKACYSFRDESLSARTLSLIADLLAGSRQPRSGDSGNPEFASALLGLSQSKVLSTERKQYITELAQLRDSSYWSDSLESMTRVARHYDTASQSLTGRCLFVDDFNLETQHDPLIPENVWIHTTAPARIDLAGGWSDTPPITNESGGSVCNVAITLEPGVHCLGASARKLWKKEFIVRSGRFDQISTDTVVCKSIDDFSDHYNPRAPGALAKCVLLSLKPHLFSLQKGVELCIWSELPPGSGLGGSSILAGCAALSAAQAMDLKLTREDIVRVVLKVEQLLSTGGGWQDQIGAIYPGFKLGSSQPKLPVRVDVFPLSVRKEFLAKFQEKAVLVQTGPARLARDLLQNVIRKWHRREPEFTRAIHDLRENSKRMQQAIICGNFPQVCNELNLYWSLKRFVAGETQAEPEFIQELFAKTEEMTIGHSLCGAGGGGFAVFILNEQTTFNKFAAFIEKEFSNMKVFHANICDRGITSWKQDSPKDVYIL